jgi:SSS family solute:Na+ symporter
MKIGWLDLTVLASYMGAVVLVGLWLGRGKTSVAKYMVGDRDLPWWLILFSIVATETSAVTFLSIPGFAYGRNFAWLQVALGFLIGRFVIAGVLLPLYFRGTLFTSYEVLQKRFGGATQRVASWMFVVTRTIADGLRLYLSAIVVQEMTGLPLALAITALGVVTIAYTYAGGVRAVLWTDFAQFALYLGGAIIAFFVLLDRIPGGFSGLVEAGRAAGKFTVFDTRWTFTEPFNLWAGLLGGVFITLGSHGVDQMMVQRYFCSRSQADAKKALLGSGFVVFFQFAFFLLIGVGLFAFYQQSPPAEAFAQTDRVFARFILDEMPTGLVGLLVGGILAAAMSSSLNSCATSIVKDVVAPARVRAGRPLDGAAEIRWTRLATVAFGAAQIAVGVFGGGLTSSVIAAVLGIAGFTTGIVLGVFFLALFAPRASERAALVGLVVGLAGMTAVYGLTSVAWPWYPVIGSLLTFAVGWLASRLLGGARERLA